jgi:hypothetical protein
MALANFPQAFTHTITSEIEANIFGRPVSVIVSNFGGLPKVTVRAIALEAVAAWEGRVEPRYHAVGWEQVDDDVVRVYITTEDGF